jgi:hypothetical protein
MNNIAYEHEMKRILKFSYFVGTFGGYDRGVIRLCEQEIAGSAGASSRQRSNG